MLIPRDFFAENEGGRALEIIEEVVEMLVYCSEVVKGSVYHRVRIPKEVEMKRIQGWESEINPYLFKRAIAFRHRWGVQFPEDVGWNIEPVREGLVVLYKTPKVWLFSLICLVLPFFLQLMFGGLAHWGKMLTILNCELGACLFIMRVNWDAFANFPVPTNDQPGDHFAGWETIAFVMASTQTTEGTASEFSIFGVVDSRCGGFFEGFCFYK